MGGPPPSEPRPFNVHAQVTNSTVDPLIALMSSLGVDPGIGRDAAVSQSKTEAKPKAVIQKLLPILHVIAVWAIVAFFVFWQEPEAFRARNSAVVSTSDIWSRGARLVGDPAEQSSWGVEIVVSLPLVVAAQDAGRRSRCRCGRDGPIHRSIQPIWKLDTPLKPTM